MKGKLKWFKQKSIDDNLCAIALNLLYYLNVPFNKKYIRNFLYGHKLYPNLSSVKELLSNLNIDSLILKTRIEDLAKAPLPMIAYISKSKVFIVLLEVSNDIVKYIDAREGIMEEDIEVFDEKWSGHVLLAESNAESGKNQKKLNQKMRLNQLGFSGLIIFMFTLFGFSFFREHKEGLSTRFLLFVLNLSGLFLAIRIQNERWIKIVVEYLRFDHNFFFGGFHPNLGCNKSSFEVSFFSYKLNFEDLGSIFFLMSIILLGIQDVMSELSFLTFFHNTILLILILSYSYFIYDFIQTSRQICLPRLLLVLIMVLIYSFSSFWTLPEITNNSILLVSIYLAFICCLSITFIRIRDEFFEYVKLKNKATGLNYFLQSKMTMEQLLEEQKTIDSSSLRFLLSIGNLNSTKEVLVVIQPFIPLSKKFLKLAKKYSSANREYKFSFLIYSDTNEGLLFTKTIISQSRKYGVESGISLMLEWFEDVSPNVLNWHKQYFFNHDEHDFVNTQIDFWDKFVNTNLNRVPAIIIDGKLVPHTISFENFYAYFKRG